MAKFYMLHNRTKGAPFHAALRNAGHVEVEEMGDADFLMIDYEQPMHRDQIIKFKGPVFIYPHSAVSPLIWDGLYKPAPNVKVNFVPGEGQKEIMRRYGYPHRVEVIGWPWSNFGERKIKEFKNIVFAPSHPNPVGRKMLEVDMNTNQLVLNMLVATFPSAKVSLRAVPREVKESGFTYIHPRVVLEPAILTEHDALVSIFRSDLVVSKHTFAYLAVATGTPTIFYGQNQPEHNIRGECRSFSKYRDYLRYPFEFFDMKDLLWSGRLRPQMFQGASVMTWKKNFIGELFDEARFVSIVESYLVK